LEKWKTSRRPKKSPGLGKKPEAVLKKLKEEKPFVWLERGVTAEQRAAIEKHNLGGWIS
jgi:hypothetical protein